MNKSKTKFVILGLLSESDLTGYEIKKIIDIRFSFFWNESYGQLYPELKKLVAQELIIIRLSQNDTKREKITYSLTDKGLNELKLWLCEPTEKESVRFELLLKLYFSNKVESQVIINHITDFQHNHQKQLHILNMFEKELSAIPEHSDHTDVLRVIDFGQKVYNAYLDWCNETIKYLEGRDTNETKA